MTQQFFYDGQIRRFLTQFIRLVSGFQVEFGQGSGGQKALQQVPVIYGDPSRQAAVILKQNSENMLSSVPAMAVYVTGFDYDRDRMQDPTFVSNMHIRKREYDPLTGNYLNTPGDAFTVERLMPVPYKLTLKLDIWTSNTEQKLQILEQLAQLFNPALEIQNSDNIVDWGSLTYVELKTTTWDSRSVPAAADESISVATMQFELPIWISSPAKVKKMGVIRKVLSNIYDDTGNISSDVWDGVHLTMRVSTFSNYNLIYVGNQLQIVSDSQLPTYKTIGLQHYDSWTILTDVIGEIQNGVSQIRLKHPNGVSETVGTIALHPTDSSILLYSPNEDTIPVNTMSAVDAIIDPMTVNVDQMNLLNPTIGTRYLILNPIGSYNNNEGAIAWGNNPLFVANANDIIEYSADGWKVTFDSVNSTDYQFVTNLTTGVQYKWDYISQEWSKSVEGFYTPGNWSIVI